MAGMKLYEATAALAITDEWLDELGGELTPEIEALLDEAEGTFAEKVERVALKLKSLEAEAAAIKAEESRLAARRKARENGVTSLKTYLQRNLEAAGKQKVDGLLCTVALQLNPPALSVPANVDLAELYAAGAPGITLVPESFTLDKRAVLDAVKVSGEAVLPNGWAVTRSQSLRIK